MFSTQELQYIQTLIPTYAKEGYTHYVIYSNTVVNSSYFTTTQPDLYAVFSKEAISASDAYTYDYKKSSLLVSVRCADYSSSSSANNGSRVIVQEASRDTTLTVQAYEHVFTNAKWESYALQPDYTLSSEGGNIVATKALGVVVTCIALVALFFNFFKRH